MLSVHRLSMRRLQDDVRDPSFTRMIDDGYRPVMVLPFEEREGVPEVFVVLSPSTTRARLSPVVIALVVIQACALIALVVGLALR